MSSKGFLEEHPLTFSWDKSSDVSLDSSDVYEYVPETQTPDPDPDDANVPDLLTDVAHLANSVKYLSERVRMLEAKLESYALLQEKVADLSTMYPKLRKRVDTLYYTRKRQIKGEYS